LAEIFFISKPVAPPWNDSSKNLVHDLARSLSRHRPRVLSRAGVELALPDGSVIEPLYPERSGGFSPPLADNLKVLGRLALGRRSDLWHFFFAPNPRTSTASRALCRSRRVPSVHTVCSAPREGLDLDRVLFADCTVVLSRHTEQRLLDAGLTAGRVRRIGPAIEPLSPLEDAARGEARAHFELPSDAPVVVYPGDLEFGAGAERVIGGVAAMERDDVVLVIAARKKTPQAFVAEQALRDEVRSLGLEERTVWVGETRRIHDLLGASDIVALPSDDLYAKMDYPLVLLEAMSMERPTVVAEGTAAAELAEEGGARLVDGDPERIAAVFGEILGDEVGRKTLGEAARSHVLTHHLPAAMARRYEALYDELLDG
jgi:phosphatidylinositol alpha-1,6-mannosyltransferase